MGRRALPKIDPTVDLSRHLYMLDEMTAPFEQKEFFAVNRPLQVEIGSGKGLFIKNAALQFPDQNFIGIEISKKYTRFAAYRLARDQIENAIMIAGDALRFMAEFVPPDSLAAVHVYFPDPWWKERHRKRRVMRESLIRDIERTLRSGGELHFWTDVREYFETSLELIQQHSALDGPRAVEPKDPEHDLDYRTHFERRMRMHDQPVYRSLFVKK